MTNPEGVGAVEKTADSLELTILMPCLNEAETLATCIDKARGFLERSGVSGEVLVADNGSTDGSQAIAEAHGARVAHIPSKGYGSALRGGIAEARGKYIIMGDADDSYDFSKLELFVDSLRNGSELVMGNRFKGGIMPGAMPFLHRYLGNPVLSLIGRVFFRIKAGDFHCGLRGFSREAVMRLGLQTTGMEFASEMVVKASLQGIDIAEVPTKLHPDGRSRAPHLNTWRDGWRHLKFLLMFSPKWLFLYPGTALVLAGLLGMLAIVPGAFTIAGVALDVHSLLLAGAAVVVGSQLISFAIILRHFAATLGIAPNSKSSGLGQKLRRPLSLESSLLFAIGLILIGVCLVVFSLYMWSERDFGAMPVRQAMRILIPAVTCVLLGFQVAITAFIRDIIDSYTGASVKQ